MAEYTIKPGEQILTDIGGNLTEYVAYLKWDKSDDNYDYDKANVVGVGVNAYVSEDGSGDLSTCHKIKLGGGTVPTDNGAMGFMRFPVANDSDMTYVGCTVVCQEDYRGKGTGGTISSLKLVLLDAHITKQN